MNLFVVPLTAFTLTFLAHLLALRFFPMLGLLDFPERYGHKRSRLPYPTGILASATFLVFFLLLFSPLDAQESGLISSVLILTGVSFFDDRRPLPPSLRFVIQLCIAFLIFATGSRIYTITNPLDAVSGMPEDIKLDSILLPVLSSLFGGPIPVLSAFFTLLWFLLTINALNWFDGIPGQVSSLSFLGFLVIGLLSVSPRVDQPEIALLSFLLAGIAAGCFLFDLPPPKVLMGDSGAMFFGLMLGIITIYAGGKVATAFLVFGVPLVDSFLVAVQRILERRSPFRGTASGDHLHHRLLRKGWTPWQIILLTLTLGTLFGVSALFLATFEKFISGVVLLAVMIGLRWYAGRNGKLRIEN